MTLKKSGLGSAFFSFCKTALKSLGLIRPVCSFSKAVPRSPGFSFPFFCFSGKGFLFTISIIIFASTLVVFSQAFSENNARNAMVINSSSKPLTSLVLNDDLAFDMAKIFDFGFDLNEYSPDSIYISGSIPSSNDFRPRLGAYYAFIDRNFFPRIPGSKQLYLSDLNDGKAEVFFGDSMEFDFNYDANKVSFVPINASSLSSLDVNLIASGSSTGFSWAPSAGSVPLVLNYYDDSNYFLVSASVSASSLSTLTVTYSSGEMVFLVGNAVSNANSSFSVQGNASQKVLYSIKADYSNPGLLRPVKINASVYYSILGFDSNSFLVLKK